MVITENTQEDVSEELSDNIIVLPVSEKSKKIRQILSNETSIKIISSLQEKSMSATQLSELLSIPLNTVAYNLNMLVENGLIYVKQIKYSEKGREIKIYDAPQKAIIFVPETSSKSSLMALIQRYAAVLVVAAGIGFGFEYAYKYFFNGEENLTVRLSGECLKYRGSGNGVCGFFDFVLSCLSHPSEFAYYLLSHEYFWFLSGCLITVLLLFVLNWIYERKKSKQTQIKYKNDKLN